MARASVEERAEVLLALVEMLARMPGLTWVDASNALYQPRGPYVRLFPTQAEREAFRKSKAGRRIDELIWSLPTPPVRPAPKEDTTGAKIEIIPIPQPRRRSKGDKSPAANGGPATRAKRRSKA